MGKYLDGLLKSSCFSLDDHNRILQVYDQLRQLSSTETSLIQIEVLFYEMFTLFRRYPGVSEAELALFNLSRLKENEYAKLQNGKKAPSYRTATIRNFKNSLRTVLRNALLSDNSTPIPFDPKK